MHGCFLVKEVGKDPLSKVDKYAGSDNCSSS